MNILLFLLLPSAIICSTQIITQEFLTNFFTQQDIKGWTITSPIVPTQNYYDCNGSRLFGGYNIFIGDNIAPTSIQKTWDNLIPHYSVLIQMKIYKIDSWNGQSLFISLDGKSIQTFTWNPQNDGSDICGNQSPTLSTQNPYFNDGFVSLTTTASHTSSSLKLHMTTNLDDHRSQSWGIRQLKITLNLCDSTCSSCDSPGSNNCIFCWPNLIPTDLGNGYFSCNCASNKLQKLQDKCNVSPCANCVSSCSDGYGNCLQCNIGCRLCTGPLNNPINCSACADGHFNSGTSCQICPTGCQTCLSNSQCKSCQAGFLLDGDSCKYSCSIRLYANQTGRVCTSCGISCYSCTSSTFCLSCVSTSEVLHNGACFTSCPSPYFKKDSKCTNDCSNGYYGNSITQKCQACVANCQICPGDQCLRCQAGYHLLMNSCLDNCPQNYYSQNGECYQCYVDCKECSGYGYNQCTSCKLKWYLHNQQCLPGCSPGQYLDKTTQNCQLCPSQCLTCTQTKCTSCSQPLFLNLNTSKCQSQCQPKYAVDTNHYECWECTQGLKANKNKCLSCHKSCSKCENSLIWGCIQCSQMRIKSRGLCNCQIQDNLEQCSEQSSSQYLKWIFLVLVVMVILICIPLQIIFRKRTLLIPFIQFLQHVTLGQFILTHFPYQLNKILQILNFTHLSLNYTGNIQIGFLNKSGIFIQDTLAVLILYSLIFLVYFLCYLIGLGRSSFSNLFNYFKIKIRQFMTPFIFLTSINITLGYVLSAKYMTTSSTIQKISIFVMVLFLLLIASMSFWRVAPLLSQQQNMVVEARHQKIVCVFLNDPEFASNSQASLFLLVLNIIPCFVIPILIKYPLTSCIILCLVSFTGLMSTFAIDYKRKLYRIYMRFRYIMQFLTWIGMIIIVNEGRWGGIIVIISMMTFIVISLIGNVLIFLSNLNNLNLILEGLKKRHHKIINTQ